MAADLAASVIIDTYTHEKKLIYSGGIFCYVINDTKQQTKKEITNSHNTTYLNLLRCKSNGYKRVVIDSTLTDFD